MATTEPGISPPATTSEVGRHLRTVRKAKGLSRSEVARSAGLTRRELAAYERGRIPVPDSDLWCLAGSCGVDVSELLPSRDKLLANSDLGSLTIGDSVARLRASASSDGLLRDYLAMIYELRNLPPGTRPPMREEDLAALADALGGTPDAIEARLHELIGVQRDEAARLRAMILPPRSLPAASATPLSDLSAYATTPFTPFDAPVQSAPEPAFDFAMATTTVGDPDAADRFFSAPRGDDPFGTPPSFEALGPMTVHDSAPAAPSAAPAPPAPPALPEVPAFDPFAPPTAAPIDPFAALTDAALGVGAPITPPTLPTFDPFAPASPTELPLDAAAAASIALDPGTFDAGTFDPGTFDPGAFAGDGASEPALPAADTLGPDTLGADDGAPFLADLGNDPAFAIEVVALGQDESTAPMPEPVEIEPVTPLAAEPEESWLATWETLTEHGTGSDPATDPFAALRVPIDEPAPADASAADPFGPEPGFGTPVPTAEMPVAPLEVAPEVASEAAAVTPDVDAFAHAYESTALPAAIEAFAVAGPDEDPDGEWFDRAAAATAALVADHLQADTPDAPEASLDAIAEPDVDLNLVAELDADLDDDIDPEDAAIAETLVAAPMAGLAPILWSLFPPAATGDEMADETPGEPDAEPDDETDVEAMSTDTAVEEPVPDAETPVAPDAQFVAAGTDWQIGGVFPATAMADDGTLALRRADVRWALADLVAGDDFTAHATVDFTSGAGFGLLFRVTLDDSERISGYSFDVDPIYGGGGFLLRQWHDNRQHWKPLARPAPVADPTRLYGHHTIEVQLRADQLTASVDGEVVLTVRQLSRCSIDSGREPCRGSRLGVQAWSTTEVTVDRLLLAS